MHPIKVVFIIWALGVLPILHVSASAGSSEHQTIRGVVLDKDNTPMADIWVRIYRGEKDIGSDFTKKGGAYAITFERGTPIDTVRFDDPRTNPQDRIHPAVVSNLSGQKDHFLSKVMPGKVGIGLSQWEDLEILSSYERLYVLDKELPRDRLIGELLKRYAENMSMWKPTGLTVKRYQQLRDMYSDVRF